MGLFRTLFIIAVSYYLIKFIIRLFSKKGGMNFSSRSSKARSTTKSKKDSKKGNDKDDLGKYVDFEEIKD
jgi:hypothetical protein